jgi:hypothetical protein
MGRGLVAYTQLETSGTPIDELDSTLRLDDADSDIGIFGDDIPTIQESTSHYINVRLRYEQETGDDILYLPSRGSHFTIWLPGSKQE